jgi:hypothetical protein
MYRVVSKVTKLFKDAQVRPTSQTKNTVQNILKSHPLMDRYDKMAIYQMKSMAFPLIQIGQRCRTFYTRYKEVIWAIKNNNGSSDYLNHILNMKNGVF